ncbi:stage II sporulation protein M [Microbacterium sp. RD1]|uniref:stage II sporulation protein M n=1 Tax=Microbacterium sp. RD1 TaxID=3457313 RepID=UPI003FA566A6
MDLDALTAARRDEWARLDQLSRARRLTGTEVDELVTRYRAASADLADIKTSAGRTAQGDAVSTLLARTRLQLTGVRENVAAALPRFVVQQLPAALYRVRWTTLAVMIGFLLVSVLVAAWIAANPAAVAALGDEAELEQYAEEAFTSYYSENPAAVFAGTVWTNNAWIAAQCVIFGITGIWPLMVLVQNAVGIGTAAAVMFTFDRGDVFFSFILPHGMLEITAVLVAAAAGLQIFWAWVAPGPRPRADALASAGRSLGTIALGLIGVLAVSGVIEGFVTPAPWPLALKIAIGALALAAFLAYMLVLGSRAAGRGESGDLTEYEAGTTRLVAG